MPRLMTTALTLDSLESEAMFTLSMLRADPNALDLEPLASGWMALIDPLRAADREFRQIEADTDAYRVTANQYLDLACTRFGDELFMAVGKDRSSSRWTRFFLDPVSVFVRQPLGKQVSTVRGWLSASTDEVLEHHRAELESWVQKCDQALVDTEAVAVRRRDLWEKKEQLCARLTKERDALHRKLAERADERGLGRTWPDLFFRVEARTTKKNNGSSAQAAPSSGEADPSGTPA